MRLANIYFCYMDSGIKKNVNAFKVQEKLEHKNL